MLEKSFGLLYYLKQPKNQKKKDRFVYLRITVDGKSKELSTKRTWNVDRCAYFTNTVQSVSLQTVREVGCRIFC